MEGTKPRRPVAAYVLWTVGMALTAISLIFFVPAARNQCADLACATRDLMTIGASTLGIFTGLALLVAAALRIRKIRAQQAQDREDRSTKELAELLERLKNEG